MTDIFKDQVIEKVKKELYAKHDRNNNPDVFSPWSFDAGVIAAKDGIAELKKELEGYRSGDLPTWKSEYEDYKAVSESLDVDNQNLRNEIEKLKNKIKDIWECLYGQNLKVSGWHLNGDLEPLDNFFDGNDWSVEGVECEEKVHEVQAPARDFDPKQ